MNVVCLDLEGVLVPEIWIAFAEEAGIGVVVDVAERHRGEGHAVFLEAVELPVGGRALLGVRRDGDARGGMCHRNGLDEARDACVGPAPPQRAIVGDVHAESALVVMHDAADVVGASLPTIAAKVVNNWSSGYVADIGYTYGYYSELNPLRIRCH